MIKEKLIVSAAQVPIKIKICAKKGPYLPLAKKVASPTGKGNESLSRKLDILIEK